MTAELLQTEGEVVPDSATAPHRIAVGVMTGTSLDGIDVALIRTTGQGLAMQATILAHLHRPLDQVSAPLRLLANGEPLTAAAIAQAATDLGNAIAHAVMEIEVDWSTVTCVGVHGQTVHHQPPHTWQLLDPAPIVAATGVPLVTGQRYGDLACGGQGAPLTPLSDWVLYRNESPCIIVNLGGFANATMLRATPSIEDIRGLDLCPCNHLLDTFARQRLDAPFDFNGDCAAGGQIDEAATAVIANAMFIASKDTTAMGESNRQLALLDHLAHLPHADAAATLGAAVGAVVGTKAASLGEGPLLMAGGAVRHKPLMSAIAKAANRSTRPLKGYQAREAAAMAVLALLELDGVPASLPAITGRSKTAVPGGLWMRPI